MLALPLFILWVIAVLVIKTVYWLVWGPVLLVSPKARAARRRSLARAKLQRELNSMMRRYGR